MEIEALTWGQILEKIENDRSVNFLAEAMTPLHVLGIEAYILSKFHEGVQIRGFILMVSHDDTGYGLNEKMFHFNCYDGITLVKLVREEFTKPSGISSFYFRYKNKTNHSPLFYYVTPFKPSFYKLPGIISIRHESNVISVITDEGAASFLRSPYQIKKCISIDWTLHNYLAFFWNSTIKEQLYEWRLRRNGAYEQSLLLCKENRKWIPNESCIREYRILLKSEEQEDDYSIYENSIVFCPSLLYQANIMKNRNDFEIYKKIKSYLTDSGFSFIIKPHPREKNISDYESLGCKIEKRYQLSQESVFAHLNTPPLCIIGDSSSVLVNANALFGIKTISINKLINRKDLNDKTFFDDFNKEFNSIVFIPKTWNELYDYLEKL